MNLYIFIIFLAEVIVFGFLLSLIFKCNKRVAFINSKLVLAKPNIEKALSEFSGSVHGFLTSVENIQNKMTKNSMSKHLIFIAVNVLLSILMLKLKGKNKRLLSLFQILIAIKDLVYKKICYV